MGNLVIGIDIGGTTTDAVVVSRGSILTALSVEAGDPITAASGALGQVVNRLNTPLSDIAQVAATGVGASHLGDNLLGVPVVHVSEFQAIGRGGSYLTKLDNAIVVSMGTGTAIVLNRNGVCTHYLGSGMGGGTAVGLAKLALGTSDYDELFQLAHTGNCSTIDLTVGDIAGGMVGDLPEHATAANFGKAKFKSAREDIARGLLNMIYQTAGLLAIASARANSLEDIILTGKMSVAADAADFFGEIQELYGAKFHIPQMGGFATAIGAAVQTGG